MGSKELDVDYPAVNSGSVPLTSHREANIKKKLDPVTKPVSN